MPILGAVGDGTANLYNRSSIIVQVKLQSIRPTANLPHFQTNLLGKYGVSWYQVLAAKLLALYRKLSLCCFDLVSVGRDGRVDAGAK